MADFILQTNYKIANAVPERITMGRPLRDYEDGEYITIVDLAFNHGDAVWPARFKKAEDGSFKALSAFSDDVLMELERKIQIRPAKRQEITALESLPVHDVFNDGDYVVIQKQDAQQKAKNEPPLIYKLVFIKHRSHDFIATVNLKLLSEGEEWRFKTNRAVQIRHATDEEIADLKAEQEHKTEQSQIPLEELEGIRDALNTLTDIQLSKPDIIRILSTAKGMLKRAGGAKTAEQAKSHARTGRQKLDDLSGALQELFGRLATIQQALETANSYTPQAESAPEAALET